MHCVMCSDKKVSSQKMMVNACTQTGICFPTPKYSDNALTDNINAFLLNSVIEYISSTKRFNNPFIL